MDFLQGQGTIERLPAPKEQNKMRSFSTSTPFLSARLQAKDRALSVSVYSTTNDSGLGASLTETSVSSPFETASPTVTVTMCMTPTSSVMFSPFRSVNTPYPSASRRSSKSLRSRRSLDSNFSFSAGCSSDSTLDSSHSRVSQTLDHSFARKLDLDLDIYTTPNPDSVQFLNSTPFSTSLPSLNKTNLDQHFQEVLQKFSPVEPDRLIGRKIGSGKLDVLFQLHQLNISCVETILSFLGPEDLTRFVFITYKFKPIKNNNNNSMIFLLNNLIKT